MKRQQGTNKSILRETTPRQNQNLPRLRLARTTVLFVVTIGRELGPRRYKACAPLRVPPRSCPRRTAGKEPSAHMNQSQWRKERFL